MTGQDPLAHWVTRAGGPFLVSGAYLVFPFLAEDSQVDESLNEDKEISCRWLRILLLIGSPVGLPPRDLVRKLPNSA